MSSDPPESPARARVYVIADKDALSNLPDDLIRLIFEELRHSDLDVLAQVSRKMSHFASQARESIKKEEMDKIVIDRNYNGEFFLFMTHADRYKQSFFMTVKVNKQGAMKIRKWKCSIAREEIFHQRYCGNRRYKIISTPTPIYTGLEYFILRFSFKTISFKSVLMDNKFLSTIEQTLANTRILDIEFLCAHLERGNELEQTRRILDWLVLLKANSITIEGTLLQLTGVTYDWLLRQLAHSSPSSSLIIDKYIRELHTFPNKVPVECISTFNNLDISDLVFDIPSCVKIIEKRLLDRRAGQLKLTINQVYSIIDPYIFLREHPEFLSDGNVFKLRADDSKFAAKVSLERSKLRNLFDITFKSFH